MVRFNITNDQLLAWLVDKDHVVVVQPGHQVPESATMLTMCSFMKKNIMIWSKQHHIVHPTEFDVLGGRGNHSRDHPGNGYFTELVNQFTQEYQTATSARKATIVDDILAHMNQTNRRFLKLDLYDQRLSIWCWIVDLKHRAKIGSKLRDMNAQQVLLDAPQVMVHHAPPLRVEEAEILDMDDLSLIASNLKGIFGESEDELFVSWPSS